MPPKQQPTSLPTNSLVDDLMAALGLSNHPNIRVIERCVEAVLVLLIYFAARVMLRRLIEKTISTLLARHATTETRNQARIQTLMGTMASASDMVLFFVMLVALLSLIGINVAGILGTASVAGLAFGFGAQKLIKDVITGFFLLIEDQYAVGDYVTVGTVTGTVEDLALRITRIRDDDGRLHTLSNGDVIQVCNHSRGPLSATIDIGIAPDTNIHQAISALEPALLEWSVTTGLPEMARVDGIQSADATRVALRIVLKTNPGQRPTTLTPRLRQICRDALTDAGLRPA